MVGADKERVRNYIRNQEKVDTRLDQLLLFDDELPPAGGQKIFSMTALSGSHFQATGFAVG